MTRKSKALKKYWLNVKRIAYNENISIKVARLKYPEYKKSGVLYKSKDKKLRESAILAQQEIEEEEQQEEPEEFTDYIYSIKLIYESSRGSSHDNITESQLIVTAPTEPTEQEVKAILLDHVEELADELGDDFILNIPYNDAVVGLVDTKTSDALDKGHRFEEVKYSHNLGRGYRRTDKKTKQSVLRFKDD